MYPSIDIFGRSIPTYGLMAAAGIVCGLLFVFFLSKLFKTDAENAAFIFAFGFIGAGVGGKLLYLLISIPDIIASCRQNGFLNTLIAYTQGGLVFYGGLLGAIAGAFITAKYLKLDIKEYYPALVPGIALFAGLGRIGCFLGGCCYGAHTDSRFCVVFPSGGHAPAGVPLVPVQLYEAVFEGAAAIILVVLAKTRPQIRRYLLMIYCASYAVFRFILEFWRGDEIRGLWGGLSTSQWISLGILAVIAFIALKRNIKAI